MNLSKITRKIKYVIFITCFLDTISCSKFVTVEPPITAINNANVFNEDETAIAAVTNLYTSISSNPLGAYSINSMSFYSELSADGLTLYNASSSVNQSKFYYINDLTSTNINSSDIWTISYNAIYIANSAIEGLTNSNQLTLSIKNQLLGESKFMRAFYYFYLVNLYGDVPLALTSDYKINAALPRFGKVLVWKQIIADLKDAQNLLSPNYLDATLLSTTTERVRPVSWVATALLARSYLYNQNWDSAVIQATSVINNSALFSLDTLNGVFLANSTEAIWQLQPVIEGQNTPDAWLFIIPPTGPDGNSWPVYLSSELLNSFENGDQRRTNWVDSTIANGITYYYPYKYKSATVSAPVTEYEMVFRLGEQYLIRAEAKVQMGDPSGLSDLNVIRNRAGLTNYSGPTDNASLMTAILHEREVELFTEWGHRWLDLKRTNSVDSVMSIVTPQKGGVWNTNAQMYPILLTELQRDPNLVQNPGY